MCMFVFSTPVPVLRAQARLWPLLVPAWRNSAVRPSLSVMAGEPATTMPTPTASGWPPSKTMRCLRKTQTLTLIRTYTQITTTITVANSSQQLIQNIEINIFPLRPSAIYHPDSFCAIWQGFQSAMIFLVSLHPNTVGLVGICL